MERTDDGSRAAFARAPFWFDWIALALTLVIAVVGGVYGLTDPEGFARHLERDSADLTTGAVEHLTVLVLIPGILLSLYAFARYRRRLPDGWLRAWVLAWSLACIYFAGEEASWGQWYFGWSTPEPLAALNDQNETNLHNMSSWLDQKPRALVELFIVVAGIILPLWRVIARAPVFRRGVLSVWEPWIVAPASLSIAAVLFVVSKVARALPGDALDIFGGSELREFLIAWFLAWYLASYWARLRRN
ncbi:MAG TPA: hypothetical protein GYA07_10225 [Verrucomicrobia bacterium]|nr:hypothetical protein [Verrucomicrobiota bacterium]HOP99195.1 hypothetical protein [Verrucomicrobiota bacterium]